jgi:hypothetical protein
MVYDYNLDLGGITSLFIVKKRSRTIPVGNVLLCNFFTLPKKASINIFSIYVKYFDLFKYNMSS